MFLYIGLAVYVIGCIGIIYSYVTAKSDIELWGEEIS